VIRTQRDPNPAGTADFDGCRFKHLSAEEEHWFHNRKASRITRRVRLVSLLF
jgi:hypothetical protein